MKSIVTALFAGCSFFATAQMAIGKASVSSPSVSLEFGAVNGTMIWGCHR